VANGDARDPRVTRASPRVYGQIVLPRKHNLPVNAVVVAAVVVTVVAGRAPECA
jgi:hypothetical protein